MFLSSEPLSGVKRWSLIVIVDFYIFLIVDCCGLTGKPLLSAAFCFQNQCGQGVHWTFNKINIYFNKFMQFGWDLVSWHVNRAQVYSPTGYPILLKTDWFWTIFIIFWILCWKLIDSRCLQQHIVLNGLCLIVYVTCKSAQMSWTTLFGYTVQM